MDCNHIETSSGKLQAEFLNEKFEMDGTVCLDCDAQLWNSEASNAFMSWKRAQCKRKEIRNRMRVENVQITEEALSLLKGIQDRTWVCDSRAVSAVLAFYLAYYPENSLESKLQKVVVTVPAHTYKIVRLSPQIFMRLDTLSNLFQLKQEKIVEEILNRLAAYLGKTDDKDRKRILRDMDMVASV